MSISRNELLARILDAINEVDNSVVGDVFQVRVLSDSDTFTNTNNIGTIFSSTHYSEGLS